MFPARYEHQAGERTRLTSERAMADDMKRRRQIAAAAFAARRGELGLSQEDVARRGEIVVKTVHNFEAQGRWPNTRTRARLERAVGWEPGEIARIATVPKPDLDPKLLSLASQLTDEEAEALILWLRQSRDEGPDQPAAANG